MSAFFPKDEQAQRDALNLAIVERDRLRSEVEQWRKAWKGHDERITELERDLKHWQDCHGVTADALEQARAALRRYWRHEWSCGAARMDDEDCWCGFDAAARGAR